MAVKNLVSGVLAQSITTSTTTILVNVAQGISASDIQSFFPTPPFYITIMPKTPAVGVANRLDSEILKVTAVGNDQSGNASLTCVRGQRDTTAKAFGVGSIVTVGVYADDAVFLGSEGSAVGTPAPWVDTSDIKNGAVTTDKVADGAVTKDKVSFNVEVTDAISILDYGAAPWQDSTTAVNKALQDANGRPVFIPAGTYLLSGPINVPSNTILFGDGESSVLKPFDNIAMDDNLVKVESASNVILRDFTVDGNRASQSETYTQYAVYVAFSNLTVLENIRAYNANGVGIHIYGSEHVTVNSCYGRNCRYHGFECEQCRNCVFEGCHGISNERHGIFISPGEVGGTGSINNTVTGCTFANNRNYGVSFGIDAQSISVGLTRNNLVAGCQISGNTYYGVSIYRVDNVSVNNNVISDNGAFGIYLYKAVNNSIDGNKLYHNSTMGEGAYDEIMLEGANDGAASYNNLISNNIITPNYARYAIQEATANDGANYVFNNVITNAAKAGTVSLKHVNTNYDLPAEAQGDRLESYRVFDKGFAIGNTNNALPGGAMGFDSPWTNVMRVMNDVGNTQIVTPNGTIDFWAQGQNTLSVTGEYTDAHNKRVVNVAPATSGTDAVNLDQLNSHTVPVDKIDWATSTLWSGKYYSIGASTAQILSEALEIGRLYVIEMFGLSSSWKMQFTFIYTGDKNIQFAYYDGSSYARWRVAIASSASGFYLDSNSTNMAANTAITKFMRVM